MDLKTFSGEVELKPAGKFKALVSTFGIRDKGGDTVQKGAFAASLARWRASHRPIPVLWNHDDSDPENIIGKINPHDSEETSRGFITTGQLNLHEARGAKVYEELKRGTLSEWSFGCLVRHATPRRDGGRDLLELDLIEVSSVLCGKGDTETLLVASALSSPSAPTLDELLAPFHARLTTAQHRVARRRQVAG